LKRIKGLGKVKLLDAKFRYTEPHSKRLIVDLTIQKEVGNGIALKQSFEVNYVVHWQ
jgi:nonsense-mediated mRNA decay protein 3